MMRLGHCRFAYFMEMREHVFLGLRNVPHRGGLVAVFKPLQEFGSPVWVPLHTTVN